MEEKELKKNQREGQEQNYTIYKKKNPLRVKRYHIHEIRSYNKRTFRNQQKSFKSKKFILKIK